MQRDVWFAQLEPYLNDELASGPRAAFDAATAASPELQAELAARRAFGANSRRALDHDLPADLEFAATQALHAGSRRASRRVPRRWVVLAAAAALAVAVLVPTLWRDRDGTAGPRTITLRSGQVVAVRFGEQPGRAVQLQAGCYDQNHGDCQ